MREERFKVKAIGFCHLLWWWWMQEAKLEKMEPSVAWGGWQRCEYRREEHSQSINGPDYPEMRPRGSNSEVQYYAGEKWEY